MSNVTKLELVKRITETQRVKGTVAKKVVQAFLDEMVNELVRGNRLEFREFGVFETKTRQAHQAQNPKTLEKLHMPARRTVKFKKGRMMKQKLNQSESTKVFGQESRKTE